MSSNVVIAGYARTPFTFAHKGALARTRPDDLAAAAIRGLLERTGVKPEDIEDLICGCAMPEGEQGLNVGRLIGLLSELPVTVAGATINRFCGSSMNAIHMAAGNIAMGAGEVFVCAGVESMTRVPVGGYNPMPNPSLAEGMPGAYMSMGETAENLVEKYQVTRDEQEELAISSQAKAAAAQAEGRLADEIVPVETSAGTVDKDGCIRADTDKEALAGLKPAFREGGSVTAGTSSPLTDGASAVLVCSEDYASKNGLEALARVKGIAVAGCAPDIMGIGPVAATNKALARAGLKLEDIDVIEMNEAFAGARITGKAASVMKREKGKYALATQCIGGGQGIATILEAV
jgi:acetyl-CoA acyltransferase